jgi:hypothetical protein
VNNDAALIALVPRDLGAPGALLSRLRTREDAVTAGSALVPANGNLHRGRARDADAACPALHPQPSAGHRRAGVLVLDVGVAGALLAAPMLATFKIVCDRISPLMALGRFLGAEARS